MKRDDLDLIASARRLSCRRLTSQPGWGVPGVRPDRETPGERCGHRVRPLLNVGHGSRVIEDELDEVDVAVGPPVEGQKVAPGLDEDHPAVTRWGDVAVDKGNAAVGEEGAPQQTAHSLPPLEPIDVSGVVISIRRQREDEFYLLSHSGQNGLQVLMLQVGNQGFSRSDIAGYRVGCGIRYGSVRTLPVCRESIARENQRHQQRHGRGAHQGTRPRRGSRALVT